MKEITVIQMTCEPYLVTQESGSDTVLKKILTQNVKTHLIGKAMTLLYSTTFFKRKNKHCTNP